MLKRYLCAGIVLGTIALSACNGEKDEEKAHVETIEMDKESGYLTNFTVKNSDWTYDRKSAPKKKRDSSQTGGDSIVNLNAEIGDAWVDVRIVYADSTTALAGGSVQRGQKQAFDYNRHVVAGRSFHIGVKKTYNTGNQGPSNDRTVTITNGSWSPDDY